MSKRQAKSDSDQLSFDFVIIYELVTGVFESFIGLGLMILEHQLVNLYLQLRFSGLLGSHHDLLVSLTEKFIPYLLDHHIFVGLFLISIGIIKLISGVGLLYQKKWADYLLVGLLLSLLPFDSLGLLHNPSTIKFLFLVINIFIILFLIRAKTLSYLSQRFK